MSTGPSNKFLDIYDVKGTPIDPAPKTHGRRGTSMRISGAAVLIAAAVFVVAIVVAGFLSGWNW